MDLSRLGRGALAAPDTPSAWQALAEALATRGAREVGRIVAGRARDLLGSSTADAEAWLRQGTLEIELGNDEDAWLALGRAAELGSSVAAERLMEHGARLGREEASVRILDQAPHPLVRAVAQDRAGDPAAALALVLPLLDDPEADRATLERIAGWAARAGRADMELRALERLGPGLGLELELRRVSLLREAGREGEATEAVASLPLDPAATPRLHTEAARLLSASGRALAAVPHLRAAASADPTLRVELGRTLLGLGRASEATDILVQAASDRPGDLELRALIGEALRVDATGTPEGGLVGDLSTFGLEPLLEFLGLMHLTGVLTIDAPGHGTARALLVEGDLTEIAHPGTHPSGPPSSEAEALSRVEDGVRALTRWREGRATFEKRPVSAAFRFRPQEVLMRVYAALDESSLLPDAPPDTDPDEA